MDNITMISNYVYNLIVFKFVRIIKYIRYFFKKIKSPKISFNYFLIKKTPHKFQISKLFSLKMSTFSVENPF